MNLHEVARQSIGDMRDGIAWVVFYKLGRGWGWSAIYTDDCDKNGEPILSDEMKDALAELLTVDYGTVFLNGYYSNVGPYEDMTIASLEDGIRWNYEGQRNTLRRFLIRHDVNIEEAQQRFTRRCSAC